MPLPPLIPLYIGMVFIPGEIDQKAWCLFQLSRLKGMVFIPGKLPRITVFCGNPRVAALVLIVEPERHLRINPDLVATTLELTPAETHVAVGLAEGKSVRNMAEATGHTTAAIYWHL